ncbi:Protein IQ-DOMAIN 1 [Bienertia sinuspersici]
MGKVGGTSWITAVKKVFRSPTKSSPKKNCKRREEYSQEDDEERKKTEKRRWIFRKFANHNQQYEASYEKKIDVDERNHAIAAAEAKTAAAKVAVATAQAAVRYQEIIPAYLAREYYAALIIQTAFRGYLVSETSLASAQRIVKLQALIRGSNIRKQAKATLKCMQTLIRVQSKLRDQSFARSLSHGLIRKSMYAESNNLWDKYKDIHHRKSVSRDENNSIDDQCKFQSYSIEDIEAMLQSRKEASLNREQALAYALSEQVLCLINRYQVLPIYGVKWYLIQNLVCVNQNLVDKQDFGCHREDFGPGILPFCPMYWQYLVVGKTYPYTNPDTLS